MVSVDARKDDCLVVAIGAGSGGVVPVKTTRASVGIGAATHIGIAIIVGTVVEVVPAVDKDIGGGATNGVDAIGYLEAHGVGQGVQGVAFGTECEETDAGDAKAVR